MLKILMPWSSAIVREYPTSGFPPVRYCSLIRRSRRRCAGSQVRTNQGANRNPSSLIPSSIPSPIRSSGECRASIESCSERITADSERIPTLKRRTQNAVGYARAESSKADCGDCVLFAGARSHARSWVCEEVVPSRGCSRVYRERLHLLRAYGWFSLEACSRQFAWRRQRGVLSRPRRRNHSFAGWHDGHGHRRELGTQRRRLSRCTVIQREMMRGQIAGKWIFSLWQMKRTRIAPNVEKMRPAG